jgi:hypothetical protein
MFPLPNYWLQRPSPEPDAETRRAFDTLLDTALAQGGNPLIDYTLPAPRWQFLCHAAEQRGLALHGSGNAGIDLFEPRQPEDLTDFGNQRAVYAASDGLWAMYFAIVDRERFAMTLANACIRVADAAGQVSGPFYVFSITRAALVQRPWRTGTVYLLPREPFAAQPSVPLGGVEVRIAQLASPVPVRPLARLTVAPEDFPMLDRIRGHEDARLAEYAQAMQTGGAWPEDPREMPGAGG